MQSLEKPETIWYKQPIVLFENDKWKRFCPHKNMSNVEIMNSVMRFSIYLFLIVAIITDDLSVIGFPVLFGIITFVYTKYNTENYHFPEKIVDPKKFDANLKKYNNNPNPLPTKTNPFMNTLLTDLNTPNTFCDKGSSIDDKQIKKMSEFYFNENLMKDTDDIYNKKNSQRQFFKMPDGYGSKHGDTSKFSKWLYNIPEPTCKEDTSYCMNSRSATYDNLQNLQQPIILADPIPKHKFKGLCNNQTVPQFTIV